MNKSKIIKDYLESNSKLIIKPLLFLVVLFGLTSSLASYVNDGNFFIDLIYLILNSLISVLIFNIFWNLYSKKDFAIEVIKLTKISENLTEAGITHYYKNFKDLNMKTAFQNSKNASIFVAYAYSFTSYNEEKMKEYVEKGNNLRVFLPDFRNPEVISSLNTRFNINDSYARIKTAISNYQKIGAQIFLFNGALTSSYYIFDDIGYISFFNHELEKGYVPCIEVIKDGLLYKFLNYEIDNIESRSTIYESE